MIDMDPHARLRAYGIDFSAEIAGLDPDEASERTNVVIQTLSWVGTPYRIAADVRGSGVDCGMLLVRVYVDAGICAPFDPRPYPEQWHLHQVAERYKGIVEHFSHPVEPPPNRSVLPGDIILFRYGKVFAHGCIAISRDMFVHSSRPLNCQAEYLFRNPSFRKMDKLYYSVWPKVDGPMLAPPGSFMELGVA